MMNSLIFSYIWKLHGYFPLFTSTTLSNRRIIQICLIDAYICIRDFVLRLVFLTLCKMTRTSYCAGIEEIVILLPRVHVCFTVFACLVGSISRNRKIIKRYLHLHFEPSSNLVCQYCFLVFKHIHAVR